MSPNFQALCYLTAWDKGLEVEGGLAWHAQLRKCKLDYSWASLDRVDQFLDALRTQKKPEYETFFSEQSHINLLVFIAFYVVELRGRVSGLRGGLISYQDLQEKDRSAAEVYGEGFHSILIEERGNAQFLPLVSVCTRLFEDEPDKSVAFSSGTNIQPPADRHEIFPSLKPDSLIPSFGEKYAVSDIHEAYKRWHCKPVPSEYYVANDALIRLNTDAPKLLKSGRVVWGAVVQANSGLLDPQNFGSAPAEIVYDPQGRVHQLDLFRIAKRLLELKSQSQTDEVLEVYGQHLRAEITRIFGWRTPPSLYPYELQASTAMFSSEVSFPGYVMVSPMLPIIVSDECPGSIIVAPWQLWPKEIFDEWNDILRSVFGDKARIHSQTSKNTAQVTPTKSYASLDLERKAEVLTAQERKQNKGFWQKLTGR